MPKQSEAKRTDAATADDILGGSGGGYAPTYAPAVQDSLMAAKAENDAKLRKALGAVNNLYPTLGAAAPGVEGAVTVLGAGLDPIGTVARHPAGAARTLEAVAPFLGGPVPGTGFIPSSAEPKPATASLVENDASRALGASPVVPMDGSTDVQVRASPTLASQGSPAVGERPAGGGGAGGGGMGPDKQRSAEEEQLAIQQRGVDLETRKGGEEAAAAKAHSDLALKDAADRQAEARDMLRREAEVHARNEAFMRRQEQLADDIAKKQLDPSRLLRNADTQTQFTIGLGAVLAGGLAAMNNQQGNGSLDRLDKIIDRDIEAQKQDITNAKTQLDARSSLFQQMLSEGSNSHLAEMQTKSLLYKAAEDKLKADAMRLGIPSMITTAEIAGNKLAVARADLNRGIQKEHRKEAIAASNAAEARKLAAEERIFQHGLKTRELDIAQQNADTAAGKGSKDKNKELEVAQGELNAGLKEIAEAKKNAGAITAGTSFGAAASSLPAFVPGVTTARQNLSTRQDWNVRAKMLVGAAYKLGTDSQEPKRMELIDEYAKPYVIKDNDNEEIAQAKMDKLAELLITKSRAKGAAPETAPSFTPDNASQNPYTRPLSDAERNAALRRNLEQAGPKK